MVCGTAMVVSGVHRLVHSDGNVNKAQVPLVGTLPQKRYWDTQLCLKEIMMIIASSRTYDHRDFERQDTQIEGGSTS